MGLEQFEQPDSWYKFDGCDFETAEDLIQTGFLGFCGCGSPDENLEYIRGALEVIADPYPKDENRTGWDAWYEAHKARVIEHFGNERSAYFFYYWATKNDLTEHGGSVPGWLTDKGKHLLKLLTENKTLTV